MKGSDDTCKGIVLKVLSVFGPFFNCHRSIFTHFQGSGRSWLIRLAPNSYNLKNTVQVLDYIINLLEFAPSLAVFQFMSFYGRKCLPLEGLGSVCIMCM